MIGLAGISSYRDGSKGLLFGSVLREFGILASSTPFEKGLSLQVSFLAQVLLYFLRDSS